MAKNNSKQFFNSSLNKPHEKQSCSHHGALTGIGPATALAFACDGAHLVVCGRRDDVGNVLVTELRALGVEAAYIRADVRHEDDVRSLVDKTIKRFGHLDVAVNNAGTEGKPGPVTEQSAESYAAVLEEFFMPQHRQRNL